MRLIYEFWRYDIATEVVKNLLNELGIPYKEKVKKRRRESLYGQPYDEWSKIYVEERELIEWLEREIDRQISNYG